MAKFDLQKTQQVVDLFKVDREQRDQGWREQFYPAIVDASMATPADQVLQGPDGFPYFVLNLPPAEQAFETFCLSHILGTCLTEGLGIVIQPDPQPPEWVFPYGLLWSFKEFGMFEVAEPDAGDEAETPDGDASSSATQSILVSQPSEAFFPPYARKVIRQFLEKKTGSSDLKVLLLTDPGKTPAKSLVFSVFAEDFDNQEQFGSVMYRLTWFLPPHYGLISIGKDSEFVKSLQPL
jgi:hypothetical protein